MPALLSLFLYFAAPAIVILVRHAEKEASPPDDRRLTHAGRVRAQEFAKLVDILAQKVPIARHPAAPMLQLHTSRLWSFKDISAARVLAIQGGMVVIVGEGDTLPKLIEALGGPAGIVIADHEFNRFFALAAPGTPRAKLADSTYGK